MRHPAQSGPTIFERLKEAIAHGVFDPGERLVERELAQKMGVSRTPIREALHRLAQDGLIVSQDGTWRINELTLEQADQLYEIRRLIEGRAAQLAALNATEEDLNNLRRNLEAAGLFIDTNDIHGITESHNEFHRLITRASHNPYFEEILDTLSAKVSVTMFISLNRTNRPSEALREHIEILSAITQRDMHSAGELARKHSMHSLDSVKKGIQISIDKTKYLESTNSKI